MLKFLIFMALVPMVRMQFNWTEEVDMTWEEHCDFLGNDLQSLAIHGKACAPTCMQTQGCTHFTWTPVKGGLCVLKQNTVTTSQAVLTPDYSICGIIKPGATPHTPSNQTGCDKAFDETEDLLKEYGHEWHKALCYSTWDPDCAPDMLGYWAAYSEAKKKAKFPDHSGLEAGCSAENPVCQHIIIDTIMHNINDSTGTTVSEFFNNVCDVEDLPLEKCEADILGLIIGYNDQRHQPRMAKERKRRDDATKDGSSFFATKCAYSGVGFGPLPDGDRAAVERGQKRFASKSGAEGIKP